MNINHRIINISEQQGNYIFTPKGDYNQSSDEPITQDRIISKQLFHLPYSFRFLLSNKFKLYLTLASVLSGIWFNILLFKNELSKLIKKLESKAKENNKSEGEKIICLK